MIKQSNMTDEQIRKLVLKICNGELDQATMDYYVEVLEVETGLPNVSDYIFWPNEVGMDLNASAEEIIERIISDKKNKNL